MFTDQLDFLKKLARTGVNVLFMKSTEIGRHINYIKTEYKNLGIFLNFSCSYDEETLNFLSIVSGF